MIGRALRLAASAHDGQKRKYSGKDYVSHPIRVARFITKYKDTSNPDLLMSSALLHDTVEDTDLDLHTIADETTFNVASIVEELTSDQKEIMRLSKVVYLKREMGSMSDYALVVKLCDRLDNISGLDNENASQSFKERYIPQTREIVEHLLKNRVLTSTQLQIVQDILDEIKKHDEY